MRLVPLVVLSLILLLSEPFTCVEPETFGFTLEIKAKEFSNFKKDSTRSLFALFSNDNRESKKLLPIFKEAASLYSKTQDNQPVVFVVVFMENDDNYEQFGLRKIPSLRLFKKEGEQEVIFCIPFF